MYKQVRNELFIQATYYISINFLQMTYSAGFDFRRQILTSKVEPRAVWVSHKIHNISYSGNMSDDAYNASLVGGELIIYY